MRSRVSASAIGASTQASRTTAYLGTSGIVLPGATLAGFLQGGGIVFGAAAVDASGAGVFCHPVQGRSAFFAPLLHVAEQIGEHDPAVPARLVVGDLFLVEEFHQRWPADPEEVSGLLGGEPLGLRHDGDHFSLAQGFDDLDQDPVDLPGKRGLLPIRAQQERWLSVQFQEAGKVQQRT
jgi:hypothetical protein